MQLMVQERTNHMYEHAGWQRISMLAFSHRLNVEEQYILSTLLDELLIHDRDTYWHGFRMAELAERVCLSMNMTLEERELVTLATLLHDIGKLGISTSILRKTSRLNDEEWAEVRRHPEIGARILTESGGLFARIAPFVRTHHERWDGLGYPLGLLGEAIPLPARIVTVIDAYDVMVSCRAYKSSGTFDETCTELARCAGSQFDPRVVRAVLQVLGRPLATKNTAHAYV